MTSIEYEINGLYEKIYKYWLSLRKEDESIIKYIHDVASTQEGAADELVGKIYNMWYKIEGYTKKDVSVSFNQIVRDLNRIRTEEIKTPTEDSIPF